MLLTLKRTSSVSVVPKKLTDGLIPEFPEVSQGVPAGGAETPVYEIKYQVVVARSNLKRRVFPAGIVKTMDEVFADAAAQKLLLTSKMKEIEYQKVRTVVF